MTPLLHIATGFLFGKKLYAIMDSYRQTVMIENCISRNFHFN
jgi:hypothetical protein